MPSFRYTARTQPGELQTGVVEASSRTAAASILQQHQLIITGLSEVGGGTLLQALERPVSFLERVSRKDIITFSQQVAILFESRVPLLEALHAIAEQTTNPVLARAMLAIIADIEGGSETLADYFADHYDEVFCFATSGSFAPQINPDSDPKIHTTWLMEKIEEIDHGLAFGNFIEDSRPVLSRSEVADGDWMETAWVLRYELTDAFEEVMITLRDRAQKMLELAELALISEALGSVEAAGDEEESAI